MNYQLVVLSANSSSIKATCDDGTVMFLPPEDNGTPEWKAYLRWLEEGNTPLPADEPEIE